MNKYCIIPLIAIAAFGFVCTATPKPVNSTSEALLQARIYKYQFRSGQYEVTPRAIEILQAALKTDPDNVELLTELGTAYLMRMTAVGHAGAKPEELQQAIHGAFEAFSRAASVDPNDSSAVAGRGMSRVILSRGAPAEMKTGMADLNAGVKLDPSNLAARLMRAFTSLAVAQEFRDAATVETDLDFLSNVARGTKAADVLAVLLADVHLETGRRDAARRTYKRIAEQHSFGANEARSRLASLKSGQQLPREDIDRLRQNLGRECTMCHGR